jgi:uncharacterized protein (TIGR02246 family)
MQWYRFAALCGAILITACAPKPAAAPVHDVAADQAAIKTLRDGYATAFNAGNAAGVAAYFAADGNDMENGQPTLAGPAAIEAGLKEMMGQMSATNIEIMPAKTEVVGDLAYDRGTYRTSVTPKGAPAPMVEVGRYLVVLRRQADSTWKIAEVMGNLPTPPEPAKK